MGGVVCGVNGTVRSMEPVGKARGIATKLNVKCTGLLGLLVRAKQRGHLASVGEAMGRLEARGGLYLSEAI